MVLHIIKRPLEKNINYFLIEVLTINSPLSFTSVAVEEENRKAPGYDKVQSRRSNCSHDSRFIYNYQIDEHYGND